VVLRPKDENPKIVETAKEQKKKKKKYTHTPIQISVKLS
jgi:hypothetical protein